MIFPNLRAEMARQGKTQNDIAELLGKTKQTVSMWMLGKTEPRISEARRIAEWLGQSMDYLFAE